MTSSRKKGRVRMVVIERARLWKIIRAIDKALHFDGHASCYKRDFKLPSKHCWMCRPLEPLVREVKRAD